jgi:carbamoyl-phosphate synthase large subunit
VKEVVFPFAKFPGVDVILGPGDAQHRRGDGHRRTFEMAFAKAQLAAGNVLPTKGTVFISVRDDDHEHVVPAARMLADAGFTIIASSGTHQTLSRHDIPATRIPSWPRAGRTSRTRSRTARSD